MSASSCWIDGALDLMAGAASAFADKEDDPERGVDEPSGRLAWFRNPGASGEEWSRHDVLRRQRGAYGAIASADWNGDGAADFLVTRSGSGPLDGGYALIQVRESTPMPRLAAARRAGDSRSLPLP